MSFQRTNPWEQVTRSIREGARHTNQSLGLLQCVAGVAEVAIGRGAAVDRLCRSSCFTITSGWEISVLAGDLDELQVRFLACAACVDKYRQRLDDTDGVGELDKCTAG
jgi:hypothetical protein